MPDDDDGKWAQVYDWHCEKEKRLVGAKHHGEIRDADPRPHCIHCGQPYDQSMASSDQLGVCRRCASR